MQTIQLYVEGMRCPRCVREATARLRDLPGVATLTADRDTGQITVTGDISATHLLSALAGSSFTAEVRSVTPVR
ncbi:heavy-metal-associated domain-containing protein [Nocardioides sp. NPDC127503]|uniref:heavy-metal-associated domain-containing protein n=1 Tax=Nocardioides sp. NPDC127503 TaxID=3154516 RepID=UPI003321B7A6